MPQTLEPNPGRPLILPRRLWTRTPSAGRGRAATRLWT